MCACVLGGMLGFMVIGYIKVYGLISEKTRLDEAEEQRQTTSVDH